MHVRHLSRWLLTVQLGLLAAAPLQAKETLRILTWPGYADSDLVAEFAERFAGDHTRLRDDEDFWDRCRAEFSDELLTDLALSCAMWLGMGRMLRTLDIGQSCKITL